jgi:hypothetical protein
MLLVERAVKIPDADRPVPPQNPVERAIVDVFKLRIELTYPMLRLLYALLATARSSLRLQRQLALENLALRQQLAILQPKTKRPRLTNADRAFWVALSRLWPDWQSAVPPQNPVDGAIVDVSPLGVKLAYPHASLALRPTRDRQIEPEAPAPTR